MQKIYNLHNMFYNLLNTFYNEIRYAFITTKRCLRTLQKVRKADTGNRRKKRIRKHGGME